MLLKQSQIKVMNLSSEQKHEAGQVIRFLFKDFYSSFIRTPQLIIYLQNQYFVVTGEQTNTSLDSTLAIPLILNRLNNLLLAEEIREKISIEAGIGNPTWIKGRINLIDDYRRYSICQHIFICFSRITRFF